MITLTINELISAVIQVLLFTLIPFIVWLITARKKESFFSWIGLKKITTDKKTWIKYTLIAYLICELVGRIVNYTIMKADWNQSAAAGMGIKGLPYGLLYAYIHTALSEEILYRGFIQKILQRKLDFKVATLIQAFIFGLSHIILAYGQVTLIQGIGLILYPMVPGILIAYTNEKKANGSILPGWLIHGTLNFVTQLLNLF